MKLQSAIAFLAAALASTAVPSAAQQVGTNTPESHPSLPSKTCTRAAGCTAVPTKVVLDGNWRWLHKINDYKNCYTGNLWDTTLCPDPVTCAKNCALEGANYDGTYGISTAGNDVTLKFVTKGQYGTNVGSRVYLLDGNDQHYQPFKLLNREFAFDVDVSQLPCGLNGALYFVQMPLDGGKSATNLAGAAYGTGYCDAQCPRDLKFIQGEANVLDWTPSSNDGNSGGGRYGACCMEMDIWEANSVANAFTSHPCKDTSLYRCSANTDCGNTGSSRYNGVCDRDGCDFNSYRMGNETFYGPGPQYTLDTTKPFTVVTQFLTHDNTESGDLIEVKRLFQQDGKTIANPSATWKGLTGVTSLSDQTCAQTKELFHDQDEHSRLGGLKQMGRALREGVVLTMSIWADYEANCLWLDSMYPTTANPATPGIKRGPCATTSGKPADLIRDHASAFVKYGNIRIGELGTTTSA